MTLAVLAACGSHPAPPAGDRVAGALVAALTAADQLRAPWRCAAADLPALPEQTIPRWRVDGHTLRLLEGSARIGVIADASDAAPATIAALARLRKQLADAGVEVVVSLGGMGTTQQELEATLGTLADKAPWPTIVLAGDLEGQTAQAAAIATLRTRGDLVIDGRLARWIELPGATIGTVPGAGARARLAAGDDGCSYRPEDVTKTYSELTAKPGIRIAATAEAPRESDPEPTGELALAPGQPIEIALHGPVRTTPSRAREGGRDGARVPLSPGTSDATTRPPGTHVPSAGLLVISGTAWTWRPVIDAK